MDIDDFFNSLGINQEHEIPIPEELRREAEENAAASIQFPVEPIVPSAPANQEILEEVRAEATSTGIDVTDEDVDGIISGYMSSEPEPEPEPEQEAGEQEETPQVEVVARPEDVFGAIPEALGGDALDMGHPAPMEEISEAAPHVEVAPAHIGGVLRQANPEVLDAMNEAAPPTVDDQLRMALQSGQISTFEYLELQRHPERMNDMFSPDPVVVGVVPPSVTIDVAGEAPVDLAGEEQHDQASEMIVEVAEDPEPTAPQDALIPNNSPTILMDDTTTRFSGAEWYEEIKRQRVILAGLGGIGSWTALQLARMGLEALCMYDDDKVEVVNMAGQFYSLQDPGKFKVTAIADTLHRYTTMANIYAVHERFTTETQAGDVMICGFDNMEARKLFYTKWKSHVLFETDDAERCLFIDGRLSMDTLQVFCIRGDDEGNMEKYETNYLFNDEEADHTVCSMKQTTYLACMIGSFIVNLFTNFVAGLLDPIIPYDLPFKTEYESQSMMFKTEH